MAATIESRVDNIAYFEPEKVSHKTALFNEKSSEQALKRSWNFESLSKIKDFAVGFTIIQSATSKTKRLGQFFVLFCMSFTLFLFALSSLPMILIFPEKFALLFSLASVFLHLALSCLKENMGEYIKSLLANEDYSTVAAVYLGSLSFTIYASVYLGNYVVILAACGLQMASIAWLMFSLFPRGSQGILTVLKLGMKVCPSGKSLLPI
jgi:hypothetical protein